MLCGALIAVLLIGLAAAAARVGAQPPSQPLLYLYPPSYVATSLGEFTIDVNIFNVSNLQGFEFKLGYNTTILDVTNVTLGPMMFFPFVYFDWHRYPVDGYIRVKANITSGETANGTGTLATITLNATYRGAASCALDLYETALTDPQGGSISHEVADGEYEFVVLSLTVTTAKKPPTNYAEWYYGRRYWELHYVDNPVYLYGNLTASGSWAREVEEGGGLVALEMVDPRGESRVCRTLLAGPNPPAGDFVITALYPSDSTGGPVYPPIYSAGSAEDPGIEPAYFTVTIENRGTAPETVTVILNAYDSSGRPIRLADGISGELDPGDNTTDRIAVYIPQWASDGNATVYASVVTGDPRSGGVSRCPEGSTWFNITGGTEVFPGEEGPTGIAADYNLSFRLPRNPRMGNYTVYVSSTYREAHVEGATTFMFKVLADAGPGEWPNHGDGHVDISDLGILGRAWYSRPGDPNWDPRADFNLDGIVSVSDLAILGRSWYKY